MSGEAWSCFTHLPAGLIDPRSASLTLNWLRPKPSFAGFKLSRDEVDAEKFERNVQIQRYSVLGMALVIAFVTGEYLADRVFGLRVFADEAMRLQRYGWGRQRSFSLSSF